LFSFFSFFLFRHVSADRETNLTILPCFRRTTNIASEKAFNVPDIGRYGDGDFPGVNRRVSNRERRRRFAKIDSFKNYIYRRPW